MVSVEEFQARTSDSCSIIVYDMLQIQEGFQLRTSLELAQNQLRTSLNSHSVHIIKMKWLVYGTKGWIGGMVKTYLQKQGETVIDAEARADNQVQVEAEILSHQPDRILCLIGRTHGPGHSTIDYLEQKGKLVDNVRDNLYSPVVLALLGTKHGIHVTYLGTGCIFTYSLYAITFQEKKQPKFF